MIIKFKNCMNLFQIMSNNIEHNGINILKNTLTFRN